MEWRQVSNDSIEGGILNTTSVLVNHSIYTLSGGGVQRIDLSDPNAVRMSLIKDDLLTPQRCFSSNVFSAGTNMVYAIGGSDCNDGNKYYDTSQIGSIIDTGSNGTNNKHWWDIFDTVG